MNPAYWGVTECPGTCPYCGEPVQLLVDASAGTQRYVEDCQVCCRPMMVTVDEDREGELLVELRRDDE